MSPTPPAPAHADRPADHTLEHEIVFAQLGGAAATIASEVESVGGVVAVTDGSGRMLTVQGDHKTLSRARDSNMAPWSCWSEWATGTNGMGTALEAPGAVLISGPEHWCLGFHDWVCAGVPVRVPALDPAVRWQPSMDFGRLARHALQQAQLDRDWIGSTQIVTELSGD